MGFELKQESLGSENANRMYTETEDQKILAKWWNKKLRADLAQELGRSEAALAQRFYAILKKQGMDPKAYRAGMKEQAAKRHLQPATGSLSAWTRDEDIMLWRSVRAGEDFAMIASRLPGRTGQDCQERYEVLRQANATTEVIEASETKSIPLGRSIREKEHATEPETDAGILAESATKSVKDWAQPDELENGDSKQEDADDFLDVLKRFPRQAGALGHRMDSIEDDMKYVKAVCNSP